MKNKKIVFELVAIVVVLAVLIGGGSLLYGRLNKQLVTMNAPAVTAQPETTDAPETAGPVQRNMALNFTVYTDDGEAVSLNDLRGKPVVVNFFASWCGPCEMEMPYFEEFYQEYGDRVTFMMVNLCAYGNDTKDAAKQMIADGGYTFPVYFDTKGEAVVKYSVRSMPTTLFISTEGELKGKQIGALDRETLRSVVETMTQETAQ